MSGSNTQGRAGQQVHAKFELQYSVPKFLRQQFQLTGSNQLSLYCFVRLLLKLREGEVTRDDCLEWLKSMLDLGPETTQRVQQALEEILEGPSTSGVSMTLAE